MQSLNELKLMLGEVSKRYLILKSNFESFHTLIKAQIEHPSINIKDIVVTPIIINEFNIDLADRKLRFKFSTAIRKDTNVLYGYIDCYLIDSEVSRYLNLREFEFNGNGVSSYKAVDNDQLNITNDSDALRIVLNFLYKSLCKR